ncbi:hypothetical protein BCR32DRAFT_245993 [Anaeromyces robustus]|uniref:Uncharacterized protein n=1 Tax=Anaeromyces robustus TaxID=1754192 RepID=A0A1Y1X2R0_9FUNG|nr:hypothetical protein BCR32DRAFT_245993 [Anaeromyces robustus]|eukprot:ORX79918.1 hypothetical protein BCR32DRAFT_245993 [Anaeromyces robustus]
MKFNPKVILSLVFAVSSAFAHAIPNQIEENKGEIQELYSRNNVPQEANELAKKANSKAFSAELNDLFSFIGPNESKSNERQLNKRGNNKVPLKFDALNWAINLIIHKGMPSEKENKHHKRENKSDTKTEEAGINVLLDPLYGAKKLMEAFYEILKNMKSVENTEELNNTTEEANRIDKI